MPDIRFDPNDFPGNVAALSKLFGLKTEADVPISSFITETDGIRKETKVELGKYKTALFLLYAARVNPNGGYCFPFVFDQVLREAAHDYFGNTICNDAVSNPETNHTTVRILLTGKRVSVTILNEPHH